MLKFGRVKTDRERITINLKDFVHYLSTKPYSRKTQLNLIGECLLPDVYICKKIWKFIWIFFTKHMQILLK